MALSRSSITRDGLEKQKGVRDDLKIIPSLTLKMKSFSIKYSIQHQQFISLYSYIIFIQVDLLFSYCGFKQNSSPKS